jgi:hypothetical protein
MRWFFFLLSILFISLGTKMVLHAMETTTCIRDWFYRFEPRILAALPAGMGALLLIGAFKVREVFWLSLVLGLLALAKGAYLAFGPQEQIKNLRDGWFEEAGDSVIRLSGLVTFLVGAAFLSWLV